MTTPHIFFQVTDCELKSKMNSQDYKIHRDLVDLSMQEKAIEVQIISLLQKAIETKLALQLGHKGLNDYCQTRLNMSEDVAYQRTQSAQVCLRFPVLFDLLAAGKTYVSHLRLLSAKVTNQNIDVITKFLPHKSKRELEAFLSTLNPDGSFKEQEQTVSVLLKLSLSQLELLRKAQTLMAQGNKFISDEDVVEKSINTLLDRIDPVRKSERALKLKTRKNSESKLIETRSGADSKVETKEKISPGTGFKISDLKRSRYIPAKNRHEVFGRDRGQCCYIGFDGKRCTATTALEIDHVIPFATGGSHYVDNTRVICRNHNQLLGEQIFGRFKYGVRQKASH